MHPPFVHCKIVDYYPLSPPGCSKSTFHVEISWDKTIPYRPGDSLAIQPHNCAELVDKVMTHLPQALRTGLIKEQLTYKYSITKAAGKLLRAINEHGSIGAERALFDQCLADGAFCKAFLQEHEAWDLLERFEVKINPDVLLPALLPLHPRFYSIASSPLAHPDRIALTVAHVNYINRHERFGVCSDFLKRTGPDLALEFEARIHPTKDFLLANDQTDIVMIGPGTGVAPFRAFMQHRLATHAPAKSWLFFGERSSTLFYYSSFWQQCKEQLPFEVSCAFSRDQPRKIYVQDRLKENAEAIWQWMQKATFYVCGDASSMAKEVEHTLLQIISEQSGYDMDHSKAFLKNMRQENRYLKDVY